MNSPASPPAITATLRYRVQDSACNTLCCGFEFVRQVLTIDIIEEARNRLLRENPLASRLIITVEPSQQP